MGLLRGLMFSVTPEIWCFPIFHYIIPSRGSGDEPVEYREAGVLPSRRDMGPTRTPLPAVDSQSFCISLQPLGSGAVTTQNVHCPVKEMSPCLV